MLKKLYNNNDSSSSRISQASNYRVSTIVDKKTQPKQLHKNHSSRELKTSHFQQSRYKNSVYDYEESKEDMEEYQEESFVSQENIKD